MNFRVIKTDRLDLINPFPFKECRKVYGWIKRFGNVVFTDESPKKRGDFIQWMHQVLPTVGSYAIADRDGQFSDREGSLLGIILYQPSSSWDGFLHVASSRKAFGKGVVDEAGSAVLDDLFTKLPTVLRLTAQFNEQNKMAESLVKRLGFRKEGIVHDAILVNGEPRNLLRYGMTRKEWQCRLEQQLDQLSLDFPPWVEGQHLQEGLGSEEQLSVPLDLRAQESQEVMELRT